MDQAVRTATLTVAARKEGGVPSRMDLAVLGLREEGDWCAIALDMSIRGYGDTFDDAFEELRDAVKAQITFALEHGGGDNIFFGAEERYLTMYAHARHDEVEAVYHQWLARLIPSSVPLLPVPEALARSPTLSFRMPKPKQGDRTFVAA